MTDYIDTLNDLLKQYSLIWNAWSKLSEYDSKKEHYAVCLLTVRDKIANKHYREE